MKFKTIILFIALGLFVVQPANVLKADSVSDILGKTLGKGKELIGKQKIKGKKLKAFILNNVITVDYEGKKQSYKFNKNTYEVYEDGKIVGDGTWAIKGLTKSSIKLSGYRDIYFQIYKAKDRISTLTNLKKDNDERTNRKILGIASPTDFEKQLAQVEPEKQKALEEKKEAEEEKKQAALKAEKERKKVEEEEKLKKEEEPKVVKKKEEPKVGETKVAKKKIKKKKITTETSDQKIVNIFVANCKGGYPAYYLDDVFTLRLNQFLITFEIDFERGFIYSTLSESNNPKGNRKFKSKDKILSYDDNKGILTAIGKPYIYHADHDNLFHYRKMVRSFDSSFKIVSKSFKLKDTDKKEIKYTFRYKDDYSNRDIKNPRTKSGTTTTFIKGQKFMNMFDCYPDNYLSDKKNPETYANIDGKPMVWDREKHMEAKSLDYKKSMAAVKARFENLEKQMAKINKQISSEYKDTMKSLKIKSNKYGSSQLQQTKKIVNSVTKEDFKTYNVTSLISYYFFDSMSNYLESLEFLYRAYDKNTDADKLKAQIAYLKSSKGSEKERLESTKQIINSASLEVQADVQNESIVLSDEAKINYQKALPFAFKATDSGYKLFVVSKGLVTEIKGSGNLLGTLLKNANELKGAATVVPLIPDYIKKVGSTAKLIFSGAKTKKIKDKENLSTALDELDLST
jgi:hypothetical protein